VALSATLRHRGRRVAVRLGTRSLALSAGLPSKTSLPLAAAALRRIAKLARGGRVDVDITARSAAARDTARLRVRLRRAAES
jgi:hypothetical protein